MRKCCRTGNSEKKNGAFDEVVDNSAEKAEERAGGARETEERAGGARETDETRK